MKQKFPSKVSYVLLTIVLIIIVAPIFFIPTKSLELENSLGVLILVGTTLFVLDAFLRTHYIIDGPQLKVQCGIFYQKKVAINNISSIKETSSILSSPAPSLDRIELDFKDGKMPLIISPRDKVGFVHSLQKINPAIKSEIK